LREIPNLIAVQVFTLAVILFNFFSSVLLLLKQMHSQDVNHIIRIILDSCIRIHTQLGPGLFESVYEELLIYELGKRSLVCQKQKAIPVIYEGIKFEDGFRADLLVENKVIVEIKSIDQLAPVHFKQLHTYLKLSGIKDGILVNFNVNLLKDGFHRRFSNF
jgi:GxxExxY protein